MGSWEGAEGEGGRWKGEAETEGDEMEERGEGE